MRSKWSKTLSDLANAGLSRLVVLGGARLVGSLLQADQIDELQLTLTPKILGGEYNWVPSSLKNLPSTISRSDSWHLQTNQPIGENELLLKYFRNHFKNQ